MTENEFLLQDRLAKIKSTIDKYGEENFYLSFSGGKDSTVLSALLDMAIPQNKIPRVYANTGIELNMIRDFVFDLSRRDDRIQIINPHIPIKPMLKKYGYPFKSKKHSYIVNRYNRIGMCDSVNSYLGHGDWGVYQQCPKKLKYQFTHEFKERLNISDKCCLMLKEKSLDKYAKDHKRSIAIVGIMREEGGRRENAKCFVFSGRNKKLDKFQPLSIVTKEWENWFIETYNVEICDIYKPPYNFERTGCKGCPFALHLQQELDTLEKFFPAERKQCELIWKPVYDEYRRLGYRLRKEGEGKQITIKEVIENEQKTDGK